MNSIIDLVSQPARILGEEGKRGWRGASEKTCLGWDKNQNLYVKSKK